MNVCKLSYIFSIPLCYPLPAGPTVPFTYTIPYFSKKRNSFHSHLTIFNIFLFLHAVFPNQKLVCYILFIVGQWGDSRDGWDSTFLFLVPVRARTSYSFLLDLLSLISLSMFASKRKFHSYLSDIQSIRVFLFLLFVGGPTDILLSPAAKVVLLCDINVDNLSRKNSRIGRFVQFCILYLPKGIKNSPSSEDLSE